MKNLSATSIAMALAVSACATVPASHPWIKVDRALSGVVCSREAAESFARRRVEDYAEFLQKMEDCEERANKADARADAATWWQTNAPWLIVLMGVGAGAAGFVIGSQVRR